MNQGGAPEGNKNAAKGAEWRQALKRALARLSAECGDEKPSYRGGLDKVATSVVNDAALGNTHAWKEIADRMDGKPTQGVEVSGPGGAPVEAIDWKVLPVTPIDKVDGSNTEG